MKTINSHNNLSNVSTTDEFDRVITAVRVRPISLHERQNGSQVIISMDPDVPGSITLTDPTFYSYNENAYNNGHAFISSSKGSKGHEHKKSSYDRKFHYDHSFWSTDPSDGHYCNQSSVYNAIGLPIVEHTLNGWNCSVLAYGQTGLYIPIYTYSFIILHARRIRETDILMHILLRCM